MGIEIGKLALTAARAAIGGSANSSSKHAAPKGKRKGRKVKDHIPPAWPLLTGAAIAVAGRAAVRSHASDWLQARQGRLEVDHAAHDEEDLEPDLRDDEAPEFEDVADDEPEDAEEPEPEDTDEAELEESTSEADDDGRRHRGRRRRPTVVASPRRMSPVRVRKLAESARRAGS